MRRFSVIALLPSLLSTASVAAPPDSSESIEIETWSTRVTALLPEVHVLLRNRSDAPVEFLLQVPWSAKGEGAIHCEKPARTPLDSELLTSLRYSRIRDDLGVVPARGWTHRSVALGPEVGRVPCDVPYRLYLRGSKRPITGVARATVPPEGIHGNADSGSIEVDRIVEVSRYGAPPEAIVRLMVRNKGNEPLFIATTGIYFSCEQGDPPTQETRQSTLRGEDTGPFLIERRGFAVYVFGLNVPPGTLLEKCRGTARIGSTRMTGKGAFELVKKYEFTLQPKGYFDSGAHGFRDAGGSR